MSNEENEPDPRPPRRQRMYGFMIVLVLGAMIALALWAWWIPYGYLDPLMAQLRRGMFWKR